MVFVDGENLLFRYQASIDGGKKPAGNVRHSQDIYVWPTNGLQQVPQLVGVKRVSYYTSLVASDDKIEEAKLKISEVRYNFLADERGRHSSGTLVPKVFKKPKNIQKSAAVDVNIVVDALAAASDPAVDLICLVSGDRDYLPLIQRVMTLGKVCVVLALSSGLSSELRHAPDHFQLLDPIMLA